MSIKLKTGSLSLILILGICSVAIACQVPVFRYALERWMSDIYTIKIISKSPSGELSADEAEVIEYLNQAKANSDLLPNYHLEISPSESVSDANPGIEIYYPGKSRRIASVQIWKGPVSLENAKKIIDSPARRELVKRILAGQSVVWVFMPGGNPEKDKKARETLKDAIKIALDKITIPEGVVTDTQVEADGFSGDPEDIVSSGIPLKIDFSVLEISRDDPAEEIFLTMFLNLEDDLSDFNESPMVFPVFGRGRVLEPLIDRGINLDTILEYSGYLCGACSCEVKDQNPGMDLLVSANWDNAIEGNTAFVEKILPPLEGTAALTQPNPNDQTQPVVSLVKSPEIKARSPFRTLGIVLGVTIGALAIGSIVLMRSSS